MRKKSVYLTEEEGRLLKQRASREGISEARVLGQAIRAYLTEAVADRQFAMANTADGPGDSIADVQVADLLTGFAE